MLKTYLRYELRETFGVISSGDVVADKRRVVSGLIRRVVCAERDGPLFAAASSP